MSIRMRPNSVRTGEPPPSAREPEDGRRPYAAPDLVYEQVLEVRAGSPLSPDPLRGPLDRVFPGR